jgi:hypothetical protein
MTKSWIYNSKNIQVTYCKIMFTQPKTMSSLLNSNDLKTRFEVFPCLSIFYNWQCVCNHTRWCGSGSDEALKSLTQIPQNATYQIRTYLIRCTGSHEWAWVVVSFWLVLLLCIFRRVPPPGAPLCPFSYFPGGALPHFFFIGNLWYQLHQGAI